ncbi:MAG: hypothetical protein AAFO70_06165 [Pseudomonadota bacterium]
MRRIEATIALSLVTLAAATIVLLASALPPHGDASASGYGIDAVVVADR